MTDHQPATPDPYLEAVERQQRERALSGDDKPRPRTTIEVIADRSYDQGRADGIRIATNSATNSPNVLPAAIPPKSFPARASWEWAALWVALVIVAFGVGYVTGVAWSASSDVQPVHPVRLEAHGQYAGNRSQSDAPALAELIRS